MEDLVLHTYQDPEIFNFGIVNADNRKIEAAVNGAVPWALMSNGNILINSYFLDSINQRGQTEYNIGNSKAYSIDGWLLRNGKLTINNGVVTTVQNTDTNNGRNLFYQLIDNPNLFIGKTLTFSILAENIVGNLAVTAYADNNSLNVTGNSISSNGISSVTFTLPKSISITEFRVHTLLSAGGSFTPIAAKLELGDHQTLAHQDANGNWVLNDPPPNKALELEKCQRYQLALIDNVSAYGGLLGLGRSHTSNTVWIFVPTPSTMRQNPDIVFLAGNLSSLKIMISGNVYALSSIELTLNKQNGVLILIAVEDVPINQPAILYAISPCKPLFDSNL